MQLFVCGYCEHVDAMELCPHNRSIKAHADWLCTCCAGKPWHNRFEYRPYNPATDLVVNRATGIGLG